MMDDLFDVQYLVDNTDYGTISAIHRLWKKRRMANNMNKLENTKKFKDIQDDNLWEASLNLKSSDHDSYVATNLKMNETPKDVDEEDIYDDTESSVDGSKKYEHAIPFHFESETEYTGSEMCDDKQSSEGCHSEKDDQEHETEQIDKSVEDHKSVSNNKTSASMNESMGNTKVNNSMTSTTNGYRHIIPNEAQDESDTKDTDRMNASNDRENQAYTYTSQTLENTLIVPTPGDGSCFYHAISRYMTVNDRTKEITIIDLPARVTKNVKEYKKKHAQLMHTEGKISKYMRYTINSFIYDNVDLLVKLFPIGNLMDDDFDGDCKEACEMLKRNAIESTSSNSKWAGTAQLFALSLLTMTPLTVWVKGKDDNMYVRGTQTAFQLEEIKQNLKNDVQLQVQLNEARQDIRVRNDSDTMIHLLLHGCHYETLVLL